MFHLFCSIFLFYCIILIFHRRNKMKASKSKIDSEFKVEIAKQVRHTMPEMHYHDFYEIYIQDLGSRDHVVSNTFYKLMPHDIMLLKPHMLHQSISPDTHTRTIVYFTPEFLHTFFTEFAVSELLSPFRYECLSLSSENYYRAAAVIKEMSQIDRHHPTASAYIFLSELLQIISKNIRDFPPDNVQKEENDMHSTEIHAVSPLISYVHENFLTLASLKEIADTFYITPSHLCRTFKQLTGYTVIQYINMLKIQKACILLHDTEKNITDIALECGFNSTMYFCKLFKATLNLTPSQYRNI